MIKEGAVQEGKVSPPPPHLLNLLPGRIDCRSESGQRLPSCCVNSLQTPRLVVTGGFWGSALTPQA